MQNNDEAELIARSIGGDSEAYAELVDRYKNAVYYHSFAIVRDEDAAEDIAQETFISAFYNLKSYNSKWRLSTWLFRISTNKCLNYIKRQSKLVADGDSMLAELASDRAPLETEMHHLELHEAVKRLKPKHRAVISLHYWQGLSYADTAVAMDAPVNSVRVWLLRAKDELRKELS